MRGKRSVLADIRSLQGRAVFEQLVKSVDVVVWNATDRQVQAMGLDADGMRALNSEAIFCQLDCFGGVRRGTRTDYLGYDDLVQAATGIMLRFGGAMETPEEHAHVGTIDVMCGFGAALGVAAALLQKKRTGRVGRPRTSLSALSGLAQIPFCYDYLGRAPFDEPSGRDTKGYHALHRVYQAGDGQFILIAASEADLPRLSRVDGLEQLDNLPADEWAEVLAVAFATAPMQVWLERLLAADIGAAPCATMEAIRAATVRPADGLPGTRHGSYAFSRHADHPSGPRRHPARPLRDPYRAQPRPRAGTCGTIRCIHSRRAAQSRSRRHGGRRHGPPRCSRRIVEPRVPAELMTCGIR